MRAIMFFLIWNHFLQVVASFGSAMVQLATGAMFGYPGVVLPSLTDPESNDLVLNKAQASLFGENPKEKKSNSIISETLFFG